MLIAGEDKVFFLFAAFFSFFFFLHFEIWEELDFSVVIIISCNAFI